MRSLRSKRNSLTTSKLSSSTDLCCTLCGEPALHFDFGSLGIIACNSCFQDSSLVIHGKTSPTDILYDVELSLGFYCVKCFELGVEQVANLAFLADYWLNI